MEVKNLVVSAILLAVAVSVGCTQNKETVVERIVPADVKPFSLAPSKNQVTFKKSQLGNLFLLVASGRTSGGAPQWFDFRPQKISFQKVDQSVGVFKENNATVYSEIPSTHLIRLFPIVSETAEAVTFDLGTGFNSLITQDAMDIDGPLGSQEKVTEFSFPSASLADSVISRLDVKGSDLTISQISKVLTQSGNINIETAKIEMETRELTLSLQIEIFPDAPSPTFFAKEIDQTRSVGFFVEKDSIGTKSETVKNIIHKWDFDKGPIQVLISAAIPAEYKQAAREGALYWNYVLGKTGLVVKEVPAAELKPTRGAIVIHWVPWLDAGAAYASGQSDPVTGEVLRAQVFMPSAFTRVGSQTILIANGSNPTKRFGNMIACDLSEKVKLTQALLRESPKSRRLRIGQDSVRATIAHEIGHALGLRHNFAASFSAKVSANEVQKAASQYFQSEEPEGLPTTTSVMDYLGGVDEILYSNYIRKAPLAYDRMAFEWAYSPDTKKALDSNVSLYCSDEDIAIADSKGVKIYGCQRFDSGSNPFADKAIGVVNEKNLFVKTLFVSILGRWLPGDEPTVEKDFSTVIAESAQFSKINMADINQLVELATDRVAIEDGKKASSWVSLEDVKKSLGVKAEKLSDKVLRDIQKMGGYLGLVKALSGASESSSAIFNFVEDQLIKLKQNPAWVSGVTLSDRAYNLSPAQQRQIEEYFSNSSSDNLDALVAALASLAPGPKTVSKIDFHEVLLPGLVSADEVPSWGSLVSNLVFSAQTEMKVKNPTTGVSVGVPLYSLKAKQRILMLKFLSSKYMNVDFSNEVNQLKMVLEMRIDNTLMGLGSPLVFSKLTMEEKLTLPKTLRDSNVIDEMGVLYFTSEVALWSALEKVQ